MTPQERLDQLTTELESTPKPLKEGMALDSYKTKLRQKANLENLVRGLNFKHIPPGEPKKMRRGGTTTPARKIYQYHFAYIRWTELFIAPPFGHFGVIPVQQQAECPNVEDTIHFYESGEVRFKGVVVAIEPPGISIRPDLTDKAKHQWKIHWLPWSPEELNDLIKSLARRRREQSLLLRKKKIRVKSPSKLSKVVRPRESRRKRR